MNTQQEQVQVESCDLTQRKECVWEYIYKAAHGVGSLPAPPKDFISLPFLTQLRCLSLCSTEEGSGVLQKLTEVLGPPIEWQRKHLALVIDIFQSRNRQHSPDANELLGRTLDYIYSHLPEEDGALMRLLISLPQSEANRLKDRLLCKPPQGLQHAPRSGGILLQRCLTSQHTDSRIARSFYLAWIQGEVWRKTRNSLHALLELHLSNANAFPLPQGMESALDPNDSTAYVLFGLIQQDTTQLKAPRYRAHLIAARLEERQVMLVAEKLSALELYVPLSVLLRRLMHRWDSESLVFTISQLVLGSFPWQSSEKYESEDQYIIRNALERILQQFCSSQDCNTHSDALAAQACFLLAELYWRTGQAKKLLRVYPRISEKENIRDEIHLRVAGLYLDNDLPKDAEISLEHVRNRNAERDIFFSALLARVYRRLGKHKNATDILKRVRQGIVGNPNEPLLCVHLDFVLEYGLNCIICGEWRLFSQFMAMEKASESNAPLKGLRILYDIVERNYQSMSLNPKSALDTISELTDEKWFTDYQELLVPLISGLLFVWASQGKLPLLVDWKKNVYIPPTLWVKIRGVHEFYIAFARCLHASEELPACGDTLWLDLQKMLEMISEPRQLGLVVHLLVAFRDRFTEWPLQGRTMERYVLLHLSSIVESRVKRIQEQSHEFDISGLMERLEHATLDSVLHILDDAPMKEE